MKRKLRKSIPPARPASHPWTKEKWLGRCAWCAGRLPKNRQVFGISLRLRPAAFGEFAPDTVQPLLLAQAGRTVPMMVLAQNSPAKRDGKDAMFQLCSEKCAQALRAALQAELGAGTV